MKSVITFLILITMMISTASAKIWKVGYGINKGDFTTIQEAHDAAASGDTIYVAGGEYRPSAIIAITKKITLVGTGYFLNENPDTQASPYVAKLFVDIYFNPGSDGSILTGFESNGVIAVNADNVIIKRDYIRGSIGRIIINGNNTIIQQNYINNDNIFNTILFTKDNIHAVISNNLIYQLGCMISSTDNSTVDLINNIFFSQGASSWNWRGRVDVKNGVFRNNIFIEVSLEGSGNYSYNNIFSQASIGGIIDNGSQFGIASSSLFIGTGSTDGKWRLKPGSPAIGAGVGGEDCGMFGGDDPYVLSGIPAIPTITSFSAPFSATGTTGLPVRIKGKGRR